MNQLLPKLKIFGVPYPATAAAVIKLLVEEKTVMRRRFSEALPADTSTHYIRRTLHKLQLLGIIQMSINGEYSLLLPARTVMEFTPVKMSKVEHLILRLMDSKGDITASDIFAAYGIIRAQFLPAAQRLIKRGVITSYDQAMHENTSRYRRYYKFNLNHSE
ncbi:hypothetical protein WKG92_19830 [Pantoea agglomerans]|uniref:hypothetical protein n=1 Tax=Enterobacter agglomerans TaxID=549 RepID=UPI003C7D69C4